MKRLTLLVRSQDGERIDEIAFSSETGAIVGDLTSMKKYNPTAALSALEGVRFEDDAAPFDLLAWYESLAPALLEFMHEELHRRRRVEADLYVYTSGVAEAERARLTAYYPDNDSPRKDTP